MFYSFTREIWENLIETYSIKEDSTACYDIGSKIFNSRQGTLSVTVYYGTLNQSAMVTGKGSTKRSTSKEKPFTKSSCGEYCMYCKRLGHTKDTCYKRYGKEKVLE
ncbi:hypothetical protein CR513_24499, partial [Mucuna pruriens]